LENLRVKIREEIRLLFENIQLADKTYFNTGKLSPRVREIIIDKITGGDNYTKIISDIYYAMIQNQIKMGKWAISQISDEEFDDEKEHYESENDIMSLDDWKKVKSYYEQLKDYNKNVFPIKDLNINNTKDIWDLIKSLNYRKKIIEIFKKFPSIASRNLKNEIRIPRDSSEFNELKNNLEYINSHISLISNKKEEVKEKMLQKIFKSNTTISDIIDFVEEKENLIGGEKITKKQFREIVNNNYHYELEIVYDKENIMVIDVTGVHGIKDIGCNSLWCFTYGSGFDNAYRQWNNYSTNDHVYVIIDFNQNSDDKDFMYVLIKPLLDEYTEDDDEEIGLFDLTNEKVYDPNSVIDSLIGLKNAKKIFKFD
jgi:hypothetical protein